MTFFIFYTYFRSYGCYFLNRFNMISIAISIASLVVSLLTFYEARKAKKLLEVTRVQLEEHKKELNLQKQTNETFAKLQYETSIAVEDISKKQNGLQRKRFEKQRKPNGNGNQVRTR